MEVAALWHRQRNHTDIFQSAKAYLCLRTSSHHLASTLLMLPASCRALLPEHKLTTNNIIRVVYFEYKLLLLRQERWAGGSELVPCWSKAASGKNGPKLSYLRLWYWPKLPMCLFRLVWAIDQTTLQCIWRVEAIFKDDHIAKPLTWLRCRLELVQEAASDWCLAWCRTVTERVNFFQFLPLARVDFLAGSWWLTLACHGAGKCL